MGVGVLLLEVEDGPKFIWVLRAFRNTHHWDCLGCSYWLPPSCCHITVDFGE